MSRCGPASASPASPPTDGATSSTSPTARCFPPGSSCGRPACEYPLAELLGVELTKGGRVVVGSDLTVPGHPDVFVVGDIAASPATAVAGTDGTAILQQVAQVAIQGGRHAATQIVRRLTGAPTGRSATGTRARWRRSGATTPSWAAQRLRLSGLLGWLAWLGLHLVYLIGFRNRANVLLNWAWNYVTFDRHSRIVAARDVRRCARHRDD